MSDFYPYLVASLPMLHFLMKPPFSFGEFLDRCCMFISEHDCQTLRSFPQPDQYGEKDSFHPIIQRWIEFDITLRNDLVRIRSPKKHLDPGTFLRPGGSESSPRPDALIIADNPTSLLDVEKELDETRWKALEELADGHHFDLGFLIIYAGKLKILERWESIRNTDGKMLLHQVLYTGRRP